MGLSEREYMRTPDDPPISNFTVGLIGLAVLATIFLIPRFFSARTSYRSPELGDEQLESQPIVNDPKKSRRERLAEISPIDINVATYNDLLLLPRVNDTLASAIIAGRPFHSVEQLDDVYGIGPKTLDLLRPNVIVDDQSIAQYFPNATPKLAEGTSTDSEDRNPVAVAFE